MADLFQCLKTAIKVSKIAPQKLLAGYLLISNSKMSTLINKPQPERELYNFLNKFSDCKSIEDFLAILKKYEADIKSCYDNGNIRNKTNLKKISSQVDDEFTKVH